MTSPLKSQLRVIAIAGQTGSGKSSLARELCDRFKAELVSFGTFVRSEAERRCVPSDRATLQRLGETLIDELGPVEFVSRAFGAGSEGFGSGGLKVVEGVRHVGIWHAIKSVADTSTLIYLDVPQQVRLQRVQERDEVERDHVLRAMSHPIETNVPLLEKFADITLTQGDSLNDMVAQVETVLNSSGIFNQA